MESVKTQVPAVSKKTIYEKLVMRLLNNFSKGKLRLTLTDHSVIEIGDGVGIHANIQILDEKFFKHCALYGDIGFGEAYCEGLWTTSDLTNVMRWVIQNIEESGVMSGSKSKAIAFNLLEKVNRFKHIFNKNDKSQAVKNVAHHYDLSNDFYELMLDETMSYSCGIFKEESTSLKDAQLNKLQHLCDDLDIQEGDHILEIGCGWGGFAKFATQNYNCKVTGVTISKEQYEFAKALVKKEGLEDKVEIRLQDYREITGQFDKVVSIEMIEQVGDEFLPEYFKKIDSLLKKDGVAVIQAITSPDSRYEEFKRGVDFIQKHIFPGTLLPAISRMLESCKKTGSLQLLNLRDIGPHYARTLRIWDQKVTAQKDKIKELGMDEFFFRQWHYYLCYCEAAFRERNISDVQITLIKPNNTHYKEGEFSIIDA